MKKVIIWIVAFILMFVPTFIGLSAMTCRNIDGSYRDMYEIKEEYHVFTVYDNFGDWFRNKNVIGYDTIHINPNTGDYIRN